MQIGRRDQSKGNKDTKNLHQPADVSGAEDQRGVVADGYGNRRDHRVRCRYRRVQAHVGRVRQQADRSAAGTPADAAEPRPRAAPPPRDLEGPGPPQWGIVHAVRMSNDGLVYVADRGNSRVQVFTLDGKYLTQVFINRKDKSAATACGLRAVGGSAAAVPLRVGLRQRPRLDPGPQVAGGLGHFGEQGPEPGNFRNAHHIATDSKGNLYTAEVNPGSRVQKFIFKGLKPQSTAASAERTEAGSSDP